MRHFVRDQSLAGADVFGGVGEQRPVGERGEAGVFHAAFHKVLHDDLVIFRPGVGNADFTPRLKGHDIAEVSRNEFDACSNSEGGVNKASAARLAILVFDFLEIAGHQRKQDNWRAAVSWLQ